MMIVEIDDLGTDAYDQMTTTMESHTGDPSQGPWYSHTATRTDGGGVLVLDLWESPDAFGRFAEKEIAPAGEQVGLGPLEPRLVPVHHHVKSEAPQSAG